MRLNQELVDQVAKEILAAKQQNLRTPQSCVEAISQMTQAEVVALSLYLVSHTDAAQKSCAYMTSLTHHLSDWIPETQSFILEVQVKVTGIKVSESEVYKAVQAKLKGLAVGNSETFVDVQSSTER